MRLIELLKNYEIFTKLQEKFPGMAEFAEQVEIIPWEEKFNVLDKNPEVIDTIEFLDMLLQNKLISKSDHHKQLQKVVKNYASKTLGMAWIAEKKVSFRTELPKPYVVLHELGHIYFEANDLFWNASYGGGETLMWLALNDSFTITEGHIRRFHELVKMTYEDSEAVHNFIVERIAPKLDVYPHLFTICLFSACIPDVETDDHENFNRLMCGDLKSEEWAKIKVLSHHIFLFFQDLISGLQYNDSFSIYFAKLLEIIDA